MAIVDFDSAKLHLRIDHDDEDADIVFKLEQASAIVLDYLKKPMGIWDINNAGSNSSGSGDEIAPMQAQAAVLMVLGELYKNRESNSDPLSPQVKNLLHRLRDPALA